MPRRSSRSDRFVDRPRLLAAMDACREAITREMARMEVNGPLRYSAATVVATIDGFALMLMGKRDYFHLKEHGGQRDDAAVAQRRTEPVIISGSGDLFASVPTRLKDEEIAVLADLPGAKSERIVSTGQVSRPGSGTIRVILNGSCCSPAWRVY